MRSQKRRVMLWQIRGRRGIEGNGQMCGSGGAGFGVEKK